MIVIFNKGIQYIPIQFWNIMLLPRDATCAGSSSCDYRSLRHTGARTSAITELKIYLACKI